MFSKGAPKNMFLLKQKNLSSTTTRSYYDIINNMREYSLKVGYIVENPNAKIDKPKKSKTDIHYYTPEEVEKLVSVFQLGSIKYQAIILLVLDLSCRREKLTGLTWADVDFDAEKVQINAATQYAYCEIFEKVLKLQMVNEYIVFLKPHLNYLKNSKKNH